MRGGLLFILFFFLCFLTKGDNVKIDSVKWKSDAVTSSNTKLTMEFKLTWEDSWHDRYNYDAVYVFFKFKRRERENDTEKTSKEEWHHVFLQNEGNTLLGESARQYDFWVSPLSSESANFNSGVYVYRKGKGVWKENIVRMQVTWDIAHQMVTDQLTVADINNGDVIISGHALEMVFVPRGPFRLGDGISSKGFRNFSFPLPAEYDILNTSYTFAASSGDPSLAADRLNDRSSTDNSAWIGTGGDDYWLVDFGEGVEKKITYFGVNAASHLPTYYPKRFKLEGTHDPSAENPDWQLLWENEGKNYWVMARDAYPIEKAIKIDNPRAFRCYRLTVEGMNAGFPIVKSIGMSTEPDLESLLNHTVMIDGPQTVKDSMTGLWSRDGSSWSTGTIGTTTLGGKSVCWPNGYRGFYAMKYELSQEQYVCFLNKLNYQQQNAILHGLLDPLKEGDYVFGDRKHPNGRNGIILATKITGMPAVFACNLNASNEIGAEDDGHNVACNYMNIADMLAYADWACLRPLSEMEYEKMCRSLYPAMPVKGGYAWNSSLIYPQQLSDVDDMGTLREHGKNGNAAYGNLLPGPLRVGAFASATSDREKSGRSFWGISELSGNLAEMYYNVNNLGLKLLLTETGSGFTAAGHYSSHGDGWINTTTGRYDGVQTTYWSADPASIGLRGGSYAGEVSELSVSDRSHYTGFFSDVMQRDSTVTFRLGRTAPEGEALASWVTLENEQTTQTAIAVDMMVRPTYLLEGNVPIGVNEDQCTYLWYCSENGGNWKLLDGACDRDYYFDKYKDMRIDSVMGYEYRFKRKVVSPDADSEVSSQVEAQVVGAFSGVAETFTYTGDTYQVKCEWDASIPKEWGLRGAHGTIQINPTTGVLSGLNGTICNNLTVTLVDKRNPSMIYTKVVKETGTRSFSSYGSFTIVCLPGVYQMSCYGAQGGQYSSGYAGAKGGYTRGQLILTEQTTLYLYVGQMGYSYSTNHSYGRPFNGGGEGYSGGGDGGGATDIRLVGGSWDNVISLRNRIMVAAGGGGSDLNSLGGYGGGLAGANASYSQTSNPGYGATQIATGATPGKQLAGGFGYGGGSSSGFDGGGGGSGWYGGSSGNNGQDAGGGGSSFISGYPGCNAVDANGNHTGLPIHFSGIFFKEPYMQGNYQTGNGLIQIVVK